MGLISVRMAGKEDRERQSWEYIYCRRRKGRVVNEGVNEGVRDIQGGKSGIVTKTKAFE